MVLLAAAGLAIAAFPFRATWWGGWILAIAEAGIVGGLADWFAVTAIFRRPLGLPIPHTALIPANWELLAARVGAMVGDRVLTREYVSREILRVDVGDLLARAAERLKREDLEEVVRVVTRWVREELPPAVAAEAVAWVRRLVLSRRVAPLLASALEFARRHGWDQRIIEALATALDQALDSPDFRAAVGELVDGVLRRYRERMGAYPNFLIGLADLVGLIDRDRLVSALHAALKSVAEDPTHPFRQHLSKVIAELPDRLRTDPELAARVEAAKERMVEGPIVTRLIQDSTAAGRRVLAADLESRDSEMVAWLTERLDRARRALASDESLRRDLDQWFKARVPEVVDRYHDRIAPLIDRGIHALGPEGAVRLIEEHAGDDLQFIRVNGTVVGGLVGGVLYGLHLLIRSL